MKDVFVLDVDGTLTDGKMIYSRDGKMYKAFGADDWNALSMISSLLDLHFISADKKGFAISYRRIEEECGYELDLVSGDGYERWTWMRNRYPTQKIIYMGDGIFDWYPLKIADYGITTIDALPCTQKAADFITTRSGGNRAVAEACLHIIEKACAPWHTIRKKDAVND